MMTTLSADEMTRIRRLITLARGYADDAVQSDYLYLALKMLDSAEGATASALVSAGLAAKERAAAAAVAS